MQQGRHDRRAKNWIKFREALIVGNKGAYRGMFRERAKSCSKRDLSPLMLGKV
jgi:hypothetical protein